MSVDITLENFLKLLEKRKVQELGYNKDKLFWEEQQ